MSKRQPNNISVNYRMSEELSYQVKIIACRNKMSCSEFVQNAIELYIKEFKELSDNKGEK